MKVAILGRGKSVLKFANYSSDFSRISLVNTFNEEIVAIGEQHFVGKDLIHVQGPGYDHSLNNYNIFASVQIVKNNNSLTPVMMQRGYMVGTTWEELLQKSVKGLSHQALIKELDTMHEEQATKWKKQRPISGRTWPTIGLFAIEFVLVTEQPDQLHLFGFDFYESDYVTHRLKSYKNTPTIAAAMKYHLEQLIIQFAETQFYIFTALKTFHPAKSNCTVISS